MPGNMKIDEGLKKQIKKRIFAQLQEEKQSHLVIVTPYPLTVDQQESILQHFPQFRKMQVENEIDKKILGGFILKIGSTIIDASIQGRITNLVHKIYGFN